MDVVGPVLDSVETTGGGWPVLVLIIVIAAIVWLVYRWSERQVAINEQRIQDRKREFEAQLERERTNALNYRETTTMMVEAFNKNSRAMTEFSATLRPMAETLERIERHFQRPRSGNYDE